MDIGKPCTATESCTLPNIYCTYPKCAKGEAAVVAQAKTKSERLEEASEIVAAAIYNARPYPQSWGEHKGVTGGELHDHFMKEGRRIVHEVLRCLGERNSIPE